MSKEKEEEQKGVRWRKTWTRCWPSGLDGESEEKTKWEREKERQVSKLTRPLALYRGPL